MATTNLGRFYKNVTPTLSGSNAGANLTAINGALATYKNTDTAVYIPSGSWPYNGRLVIDSATLYGEADSILVGNDGTASPEVDAHMLGIRPKLMFLTLTTTGATVRTGQPASDGVTMDGCIGGLAQQVTVNGPASAAFFIYGGKNNRTEGCIANGSLADGFHHTNTLFDSECSQCTANNVGDDMFPVVSYTYNAAQSQNILFTDGVGVANTWGRGIAVVGGKNITYRRMQLTNVNLRGIYMVVETGSFNTYGIDGVVLDTIDVNGAGLNSTHQDNTGCVGLIVGGTATYSAQNITTRLITMENMTDSKTKNIGFTSNVDLSGVL